MQNQNELRGALFKNDRRTKESQPAYKGDVIVGGQKYWLSAWVKDGQRGKYFSLALTPADEAPRHDDGRADVAAPQRSAQPRPTQPTQRRTFEQALDDEIPF